MPRIASLALWIGAATLALSMGLRQSLSLFLPPMTAGDGVSATAFGLAMALQNLVWGLAQPVIGAAADRMGARPVLFAAALTYAGGLLLAALAQDVTLGLLLGAGALVGLGVAGTAFGVVLGLVARNTPPERRSWALGLVSAAGSLGTMVLAPLGQVLLEAFGWRGAMLAFAGVALTMGLLAMAIGRAGDASAPDGAGGGQTTEAALREALSHRGFLCLALAFFACGFQLVFIGTHLPRYLAICGLPPAVGAWALALIGLFNAVGSLGAGWLGQRYDKSKLLAGTYALRTLAVAIYLLVPVSPASTLVFAAAMGTLWLSVAPLVSGLIGGLFGLRHFNLLFGVVFLSHQMGSFAGAWAGGAILDATGSYLPAWWLLVAVGAVAMVVQWLMDQRPPRQFAAAGAM
jgi:predicted MFS family arabinose efflux permease